MAVSTNSFVWPPDYNWRNAHSETNVNVLQQSNFNRDLFLPWLMTVWMLGTSIPKTEHQHSKSRQKVKPTLHYNNPYSLKSTQDIRSHNKVNDYFYEIFSWNKIELKFPSEAHRRSLSNHYIPKNILPLGLEIWKERIFLTLPKWKEGIPVTLTSINKNSKSRSPTLRPYPDWSWFDIRPNCDKIVSAFRMSTDPCGRLWVIDSGAIDIAGNQSQVCPAKILIFNLGTDELVHKFTFPFSQILDGSLLTYITVDVREDCNSAVAYIADVFRYGLLVYSLQEDRSWRIGHSYFYPDPLLSHYNIDGIRFQWVDGIFSMALSPVDPISNDRYLYFHALSSNREFRVPVSRIMNETLALDSVEFFEVVGDPRGGAQHHASGSAMDAKGILFYNLPSLKAIGCWNSLSYRHSQYSQGIIAISNASLSFPNGMKLDNSDLDEDDNQQRLYVISNKLHQYLYGGLDPVGPNYVLTSIHTKRAVRNTVCGDDYDLLDRALGGPPSNSLVEKK